METPDSRRRVIEADARNAAETGREEPQGLRSEGTGSYWDRAQAYFEVEVWGYALNKRKARLKRMKEV